MKRKMFMFDYARLRSLHKGELSCLLGLLSRLGYSELGLYLEGAFSLKGEKGLVRESSLSFDDAEWILSEAKLNGITILPMTNVLYHMEHFLTQERYSHLRRSGPNERYLINYESPAAVDFAMTIIRSLAAMFHTDTIHIGLDEFPFRREEIPAIGRYIAEVTGNMIKEGLTPCVWGDMFWMEQILTAYLPKKTEIYDWNYYGHRPESLRYFREEGFAQVIGVPCDNGWEGFTGCQRVTGYLRSRTDIPVEPGEIEAFMQDAKIEGADGIMVADWENTVGRSVWAALVPIARAGLWLQGKWNPSLSEEEQVENALFGRMTPYTRIVQYLRKLQMLVAEHTHIRLLQDALYRKESMLSLLNKPIGFWNDVLTFCDEFLPKSENELREWIPYSITEKYAKNAMHSALSNVSAACCLMRFSQSRAQYHEAAIAQFVNPSLFVECLGEVEKRAIEAKDGLRYSKEVRSYCIADTGITRQDLLWQDRLIDMLDKMQSTLHQYLNNTDSPVALKAFTEFLYNWEFAEGGYVET